MLIKLINSSGLFLDIVGAWIIYFYVFNKPTSLITQSSLPSSLKTEIIDGCKTSIFNCGVTIDIRAVQINAYNEYKDKLFDTRARFGFFCLTLGFSLQIISNISPAINETTVILILIISAAFLFLGYLYLFVYLHNLPEIPKGAGVKFIFEQAPSSGGNGFTINSDVAFQKWSKDVLKLRARIGLTK